MNFKSKRKKKQCKELKKYDGSKQQENVKNAKHKVTKLRKAEKV